MAGWVIRRAAALVAVPWRHGMGTTRDVVTVNGPDGALRWQVSIADLVQDAAFSHFPHCDRVFTPIAGDPPPELAVDGGRFEPCPLLVPRPFSGEVPTLSRIPAPGRAFNAVADRRHHRVTVAVQHLVADAPVALPDAAHTVVYCHAGEMEAGEALAAGDAAVGTGPCAARMVRDGTVLAVSVWPAGGT